MHVLARRGEERRLHTDLAYGFADKHEEICNGTSCQSVESGRIWKNDRGHWKDLKTGNISILNLKNYMSDVRLTLNKNPVNFTANTANSSILSAAA